MSTTFSEALKLTITKVNLSRFNRAVTARVLNIIAQAKDGLDTVELNSNWTLQETERQLVRVHVIFSNCKDEVDFTEEQLIAETSYEIAVNIINKFMDAHPYINQRGQHGQTRIEP